MDLESTPSISRPASEAEEADELGTTSGSEGEENTQAEPAITRGDIDSHQQDDSQLRGFIESVLDSKMGKKKGGKGGKKAEKKTKPKPKPKVAKGASKINKENLKKIDKFRKLRDQMNSL